MRISDFIARILGLCSVVLLKWPAMIIISTIIAIELIVYFSFRSLIYFLESLRIYRSHRKLRRKVRFGEGLNSHAEWHEAAKLLDRYDGREKWKAQTEDPIYNHQIISKLVLDLHLTRTKIRELMAQRDALIAMYPTVVEDADGPSANPQRLLSHTSSTGSHADTGPALALTHAPSTAKLASAAPSAALNPIDASQLLLEPTQSLFEPSHSVYGPFGGPQGCSGDGQDGRRDSFTGFSGPGLHHDSSTENHSQVHVGDTDPDDASSIHPHHHHHHHHHNFPHVLPALSFSGLSSATKRSSTFPNYSNNTNFVSTTIPLAPVEPSSIVFQPSASFALGLAPAAAPHEHQTRPGSLYDCSESPPTPASAAAMPIVPVTVTTSTAPADGSRSATPPDPAAVPKAPSTPSSPRLLLPNRTLPTPHTSHQTSSALPPTTLDSFPNDFDSDAIELDISRLAGPDPSQLPATERYTHFTGSATQQLQQQHRYPQLNTSDGRGGTPGRPYHRHSDTTGPSGHRVHDITVADIVAGVMREDLEDDLAGHPISTTDGEFYSDDEDDDDDDDDGGVRSFRQNNLSRAGGYNSLKPPARTGQSGAQSGGYFSANGFSSPGLGLGEDAGGGEEGRWGDVDADGDEDSRLGLVASRDCDQTDAADAAVRRKQHRQGKTRNGQRQRHRRRRGPLDSLDGGITLHHALERAGQATRNTAEQVVGWFQKTAGPVVEHYASAMGRRSRASDDGDDEKAVAGSGVVLTDGENEYSGSNDGLGDPIRAVLSHRGPNKTRLSRTASAVPPTSTSASPPLSSQPHSPSPGRHDVGATIAAGVAATPTTSATPASPPITNIDELYQSAICSKAARRHHHSHNTTNHQTTSPSTATATAPSPTNLATPHPDHSPTIPADLSWAEARRQVVDLELQLSVLLFNLIHFIQLGLRQSIALLNEELYSYTNVGTKYLISTFTNELVEGLRALSESPQPPEKRLELFLSLSKLYGHNALCLSGGAGFCGYHWGLVKALIANNMLSTFKVFSGTSAGSMVAAHICTRTDEELMHGFSPDVLSTNMKFDNGEGPWHKLTSLLKNGYMIDSGKWTELLQYHCCGDMTFLEAYQKTGRVLVITATPAAWKNEPPIFLSYLTSPHCVIRSACVASATIPYLLPPSTLLFKDPYTGIISPDETAIYSGLRDGSFAADIPNVELAYYFNTSFHLVSQVNPHISLFYFNRTGASSRSSTHWGWSEFRGTFFLSFIESWLKYDMVKNLQIMKEMKLFPQFVGVGDISNIFLQNFSGPTHSSVCVVPDTSARDYVNLLSAPSPSDLRRMIKGGEMMLYFKKALLDGRLAVSNQILLGIQQAELAMGKRVKPGTAAAAAAAAGSGNTQKQQSHHKPHQKQQG